MLGGLIAFAGATLVLSMSPGPASVLVIRQTLYGGRRTAALSILGNASGQLAWVAAAELGMTALITGSHGAYQAVRIIGAAVLMAFGVRALIASRRGAPPASPADPAAAPGPEADRFGAKAPYQVGLLTCLTNPKAAIFAAALLPQFVSLGTWSVWAVILYSLVWCATSSAWYMFLSLLLQRSRWIHERPSVRRRLEQLSGLVLLAFGVWLAVLAV